MSHPKPSTLIKRAVAVLPTYDERDNIAAISDAVLSLQPDVEGYELHVLISDSNSTDGTLELAEKLSSENDRIHVINVKQRGIGRGIYYGMLYAIEDLNADVLIEMDSDFQHNPHDIPIMLGKIDEGYDVVVGSRFLADSINNMPFYRKVMSVGANGVLRVALGMRGVTEITTSFRAIKREAFLLLDKSDVPWDEEKSFIAVPVFLVQMLRKGATATEVPMTMHPRVNGYSKMIYWRYIRDVLWYSLRNRLGLV